MKNLIVLALLAMGLFVGGCSHRKYDLVNGTVEVAEFFTKTEIPYLYYADDDIHLEIENFKKTPVDVQFQAYQFGLAVGRRESKAVAE